MRLKQNICLVLQVLWTELITLAWSQNAQVQACTTGWFGSNCRYKCRCNSEICGFDGSCADGVCKSGWFGPGCQYVDLVYNNATRSIPRWLYDGDSNSCNSDRTIQPLNVDMILAFPFTWLRLQVKNPSLLHQFQIMFSNNSYVDKFSCVNRNSTVNAGTLDVYCDLDVTVRFVILRGEGVKSLCSLYISGGRNVALRQNTNQSSTYSSKIKNHKRELSIAENAVDGNTNNEWKDGSCTSTNNSRTDKSPTWNVTFSHEQMIHRYVLYNRDNNMERLKGFTLTSFTNDLMVVMNYTDTKTGDPLSVYTLTSMDKTRPIALVKIQAKDVLTLCEVELYGDSVCEPSMYGRECEHRCNCAVKNEACFVSTGGCPSGCSAGFQGESCNQHCDYGKYGEECSSNCSQFCMATNGSESPCHHIDGACRLGCKPGYQVPNCDHLIMDDNSFPVAVIAGLLIAVVALVVVATLCVILWRRRAAAKDKNMSAAVSNDGTNLNQNGRVTFRELESTNSYTRSDYKENQQAKQVTKDKQKKDLKTKTHFTDEVYHNVISAASSTSISVRDLSDFMASHDKAFFQKQFNAIPANTNATTTAGKGEENKHKNRYKNICAYDHSRVVLKINKEKTHGDYINASYIEGYKGQQKFIASQGPTKEILEDFVRMLSEQGIEVVVMLTNLTEDGKTKCERYWPEDYEMQKGDIKVKLTTTQVFADYTIRRLQLLQEGQPVQTLTQFHFTSWPDKDVPTTAWSLVDFEQRVASISTDKPIVVHCSAGVGRTGTFIALYNVLRQAVDTGYVDLFTAVQKLRNDRVLMVQTPEQYEFLHRAAQVAVACMGTTIMSSNITERVKADKSELEKEFNTVCSISDDNTDYSGDEKNMVHISSAYENSQTLSNKLKNRFQNVLAKEDYRVILIGGNEGDSGNYINAVFMPSFCRKNQQILTQLPLPTTVVDFWRMVTQYKVTLVVALEVDLMPTDSSIGNYFPRNENEEVYEKSFKIKSQQISPGEFWNEQKLVITMDSNKSTTIPASSIPEREHHLIHLTCKDYPANLKPVDLLALMKAVRSHTPSGGGRTVYMCRNGAEYSGLVCVLSLLLDRLDNDHRLTVPLVVGAIKAIRPQVIPTVHQYELLYQVLRLYNDSNNVYSNF